MPRFFAMTSAVEDRYAWLVERVRRGEFDEQAASEGFAEEFLVAVPAARLVEVVNQFGRLLDGEPAASTTAGFAFRATYDDVEVTAAVEATEPHRFRGLRFERVSQLKDPRLDNPPLTVHGDLGRAKDVLPGQFAAQEMIGAVAARSGDNGATAAWSAGIGFVDIDEGIAVQPQTPMLAGSFTKLLTANVTLQLVAEGKLGLDDRVNDHLQSLRLASDAVTVRHLLTHTAGVSSAFNHYVDVVPASPAEVMGAVVAVDFQPGSRREYSNGGYAVLGEVVAAEAGMSYAATIGERVFKPLGMSASSFATHWPDWLGPGYSIGQDGRPRPVEPKVPSVLAAGGLLTTTGDLLRFVAGWRSLLPEELAQASLRAQATRPGGTQGFGWLLPASDDSRWPVVGHSGGVMGYRSSLLWAPDSGAAAVVITNRSTSAEAACAALLRLEL